MSLPLSGQLGSAQLGAAELGQLQSASVILSGAAMLLLVGGGAVQEPPQKKRKKKKKLKRVKVKAARQCGTERPEPDVPPNLTPAAPLNLPPLNLSEPIRQAMAETIAAIEEAQRRRKLQEQLEEEDELLLVI